MGCEGNRHPVTPSSHSSAIASCSSIGPESTTARSKHVATMDISPALAHAAARWKDLPRIWCNIINPMILCADISGRVARQSAANIMRAERPLPSLSKWIVRKTMYDARAPPIESRPVSASSRRRSSKRRMARWACFGWGGKNPRLNGLAVLIRMPPRWARADSPVSVSSDFLNSRKLTDRCVASRLRRNRPLAANRRNRATFSR